MEKKRNHMPLFLQAGLLFGLKTYIVYRFIFQIDIDNLMQEVILFINPFITSIIFFGLSIWLQTTKKQLLFIRYSALIGTIIIYFNLLFYRSFTDFLTIPQLFQTSNLTDLSSSIFSLIKPFDVLLFVDVVIIWYICKKREAIVRFFYGKRHKVFALVISLLLLSGNFLLAEMERPQLLSRAFDREYLVKNIGIFYYHLYDVAMQSKMRTQKVLADDNDLLTIKGYINDEIRSKEESGLFGIGKGRNIIFISAESIQSFVINNEVHGEAVTPFLNSLVDDPNTFYFENFYHQTSQGKTSDSEFITENSLYPISSGAVFFTHAQNEYHSMPEIMKKKDYQSVVLHANTNSFWNRNQMYESLEIEQFFDKEFFDVTEENEIGWGLKDKEFFTQSIPYLRELEQPFYAKMITITNHFPFELNEGDRSIEPYDSNSNTLNNYFPTVRYTDEAIEQFFIQLKAAGLYDNSMIIIMGDHDGISANHNKAMAMYLNKEEITPYDYMQLQRVPFYIHIPGYGEGKKMSKIAGQIDIKPTLLHLLGIETNHDIYFGNDLFHDDRKGYIVQRNGNFVSDEYVYASEICFDRETGEVLAAESETTNQVTPCSPIKEKVEKELTYSDQIIYGDLFRFIDFETE
ncbi:LTA synthase family protein [Pseudogracilibacillus auburnensis]|uniref:Putative sulfatase n=1 Tax=Pseudogracilibacillus auburnensis TaxID=1494959 RepID=A0A2V3W021_9BACI|nr:LTA synthase family protein [Pseudogracilibacillus auburnensis]MBO1003523.1 LTA synthase family protein [Pseudogracilibacillus auburnensis]PXW86491.1 putative sulfatase [Pseudogracilibacillus auburnensis]